MVIRKSTLLILDNDLSIEAVLQRYFIRFDFNVIATDNVSIAFNWIIKHKINLVTMDITVLTALENEKRRIMIIFQNYLIWMPL